MSNGKFSAWRILMLIVALAVVTPLLSCGGGGGGGGGGGSDDYSYLYRMNAIELGGHTIRWASSVISVSPGDVPGVAAAVNKWSSATGGAVSFAYVGSGANVSFRYGNSGGCGLASISYTSGGVITDVSVLIEKNQAACDGGLSATVTHEAGHAIGFMGHDTTGIMHPYLAGPITGQQAGMIRLLYSMPPGTDINQRWVGAKVTSRGRKYDKGGGRIYHLVIRKACAK